MKILKLDHEMAKLVHRGERTTTWRLYDDKDLRVNDKVELVDKVDSGNPETWTSLGVAHIDAILEKRLGEVTQADIQAGERLGSPTTILKEYQKYYGGPRVTLETPVKIVRFTLEKPHTESVPLSRTPEAKLYADGGSRGNPGPSAAGFVITNMDEQTLLKKGVYLGVTTNNQAEYHALKLGLEEVRRMNIGTVHVYMDSLLVINQMQGIFKVKNRDLWPIYEDIKELVKTFSHISFAHVPRELNKAADSAVNEALDAAAK